MDPLPRKGILIQALILCANEFSNNLSKVTTVMEQTRSNVILFMVPLWFKQQAIKSLLPRNQRIGEEEAEGSVFAWNRIPNIGPHFGHADI